MQVIERDGLDVLFRALGAEGYAVVGPTIRDGAIVYDRVRSTAELPEGWTDEQEAGRYRLRPRGDRALFGYAVGPATWKAFLHPPAARLWRARRDARGFAIDRAEHGVPRLAFVGVRPCELSAIRVQDRVFRRDGYDDPIYGARRDAAFIVAVNCTAPADTCFCASLGSGPVASDGYDLALTEIMEGDGSQFTVVSGTERGARVLAQVPRRAATAADEAAAAAAVRTARRRMGRTLDTADLPELFTRAREHPRWEDVARRCLGCGSCTSVCPTCFCTRIEDTTSVAGDVAERWRRWDSCFTLEFSHLPGGSVRRSGASRYRQWLTHKLATWQEQFATLGCVGCGRCITWCPAGIDLTEEVAALRTDPADASNGAGP